MQYALLNRFHAALFGARLGESIASQSTGLADLTRFYAESLIVPQRVEEPQNPIFQLPLTTAEAAIALLPVGLFFHEDRPKLHQNLQAVIQLWQRATISLSDLHAIVHTLSAILLETLDVPTCIPTLLQTSEIDALPLLQSLQQVHTLVMQPVGREDALASIRSIPGDSAIALALYCFLSTAGDFRLSLLRAQAMPEQTAAVCAIVGALSGAYNSLSGIPIEWRLQAQQGQIETRQLAAQLLAQWAGVHNLETLSNLTAMPIVTAPRVMRRD